MKNIYCYPFKLDWNEYIENTKRIWREGGYQVKSTPYTIRQCLAIGRQKQSTLVLNWYEDVCTRSNRSFLMFSRNLVLLMLMRFNFGRLIWVRHNLQPHTEKGKFYHFVTCRMLHLLTDSVVTHRPMPEWNSFYVPHPLYDTQETVTSKKTIDYLYFGLVKRYKGLLPLLEHWPRDKRLCIYGKCVDPSLAKQINHVIEKRELQVEWHNAFVPKEELNQLIASARCIVLPHADDAMIVSGSFYHAISMGTAVLLKEGQFSHFAKENFASVEEFNWENLEEKLALLRLYTPEKIKEEAERICSDSSIMSSWRFLFGHQLIDNQLVTLEDNSDAHTRDHGRWNRNKVVAAVPREVSKTVSKPVRTAKHVARDSNPTSGATARKIDHDL